MNVKKLLALVLGLCLCLSMLALPSAAVTFTPARISLSAVAAPDGTGKYDVSYTAVLNEGVGETIATIVQSARDAGTFDEDMTFICTLSDSMIGEKADGALTAGDLATYSTPLRLRAAATCFEFVSAAKTATT